MQNAYQEGTTIMPTINVARQLYETQVKDWPIIERLGLVKLVMDDLMTASPTWIVEEGDAWNDEDLMAVAPYEYLVERPETDRKQLYLRGRTMTVGQLVYTMRANQLSVEEAAQDMDLPLSQVKEAMAYYETHQDLVESEAEKEKQYLLSKGVKLESGPVLG